VSTATVCDGCGAILPSRATPESVQGWRRHALNWNGRLHYAHTCPTCPESKGVAVLEALKQ
jgi:hypothetical protein